MNPKARFNTSLPTIQNTPMWQDPHKPSHTVGDFENEKGSSFYQEAYANELQETAKQVGTNPEIGVKYNEGKIQYSLIPPYALQEVARNLTIGATKYKKFNWMFVPNARERYLDALMRHLESYRRGVKYDPESSVPDMHELSAVIANAMFLLEFDLNPNLEEVKE